jgi:hypothetical protein
LNVHAAAAAEPFDEASTVTCNPNSGTAYVANTDRSSWQKAVLGLLALAAAFQDNEENSE